MEYLARPHQMKVLDSDKKITFMGGGVGSGKTDVGSLWMLRQVKATPKAVLGAIVANSYTQLKDSTLRNVYKNFKAWGIKIKPKELPDSYGPMNLRFWNGKNYVEILCRSLSHYELLSGVELGWGWVDEAWGTTKSAIELVLARVRDKAVENRILLTTVLDDPSSWMFSMFVDEFDPEIMQVTYASSYDNQVNLPAGYIEGMKRLYTKKMFKRMVEAKWVSLEGSTIYSNFDRAVHVTKDAEFNKWLPVCWCLDFNIGEGKPMSSVLAHITKGVGVRGVVRPEVHFFDEIVIQSSDTNDAIEEYEAKNWLVRSRNPITKIYGDASGRSKDTRSRTTDYEILKQAGYTNQNIPKANPPIRDRHNVFNRMLCDADDDVRIFINPRCKVLIKGLETTVLRKGAQYLEQETYSQHICTAAGYFLHKEFPIKSHWGGMQSIGGF